MPLTELTIKNLKPRSKPYRISDGGGLSLEVSISGGKLWRYRYKHLGKEQLFSLGKYPAISLAKARKLRDEAREKQEAGKHLTREKNAEKLRRAYEGANTFEKIARLWHGTKQEGLDKKYKTQCLARLEQHVFPMIGDLPVTEITIPDVVRAVEKIAKSGRLETAKRIKQMIARIFRFAAQRGLCTYNPAADLRDVLPSPVKKHYNCIHVNEFPELLQAIKARDNDMSKQAMQLIALTFVRTGELIGARWEEIDWDKGEWHIPKERMKKRRPHVVPLSKQAIFLLTELHKKTGDTPHVFYSSASKARHISNGTILMALRRMGYEGKMTGHGFRALASTILNEKGYPPDVIERQLAHEDDDKVRAAYNRAEYLPERKKMMQDYANILDALEQGKEPKKEKVNLYAIR